MCTFSGPHRALDLTGAARTRGRAEPKASSRIPGPGTAVRDVYQTRTAAVSVAETGECPVTVSAPYRGYLHTGSIPVLPRNWKEAGKRKIAVATLDLRPDCNPRTRPPALFNKPPAACGLLRGVAVCAYFFPVFMCVFHKDFTLRMYFSPYARTGRANS